MVTIPADYAERVYAGVLGKIIGVYLGRPFEGWTYERIMAELGEIGGYIYERLGKPLIVTDDDISGTFSFLRALPDHGNRADLTPREIGETWLNYLIDRRTILWWGGMGVSTEHTAYLRLRSGIEAPHSGSIATHGRTVAEQIGSQIFIDGWAMICPGDPERAADFARRAASVSHDGEAIYGAQVVAALEAAAFGEPNIQRLLDTAVSLIPRDSIIARCIADVRDWHEAQPQDWHATRAKIAAHYGYDTYGGNCHMVPNHALIIHALLHGDDDFAKSQRVVNTCGWDTDCNAGNVGCILGIKNGLAAFDGAYDWRGPVADRMYLATADGGRAITDAVTEAYHVVNIGRALAEEPAIAPKGGARFHFSLSGAVQGFQTEDAETTITNEDGRLAIRFTGRGRIHTPTFVPPDSGDIGSYGFVGSPSLYPGQVVRVRLAATGSVAHRLFIRHYNGDGGLTTINGDVVPSLPTVALPTLTGTFIPPAPDAEHDYAWTVPQTGGQPIAQIGIECVAADSGRGTASLDWLTWDGTPSATLGRPEDGGAMWRQAWVDGVDQWQDRWREPYRIVQNTGTGLISQGAAQWEDYEASVSITPYLAARCGVGVRCGGMNRWYALLLCAGGVVHIVKSADREIVLAEAPFAWEYDTAYTLTLHVSDTTLIGTINGEIVLTAHDDDETPLPGGGVALIVTEGAMGCGAVQIAPATRDR